MARNISLFVLLLHVAGAFDGLRGNVEEECIDLAEEGTRQCEDWAMLGEW